MKSRNIKAYRIISGLFACSILLLHANGINAWAATTPTPSPSSIVSPTPSSNSTAATEISPDLSGPITPEATPTGKVTSEVTLTGIPTTTPPVTPGSETSRTAPWLIALLSLGLLLGLANLGVNLVILKKTNSRITAPAIVPLSANDRVKPNSIPIWNQTQQQGDSLFDKALGTSTRPTQQVDSTFSRYTEDEERPVGRKRPDTTFRGSVSEPVTNSSQPETVVKADVQEVLSAPTVPTPLPEEKAPEALDYSTIMRWIPIYRQGDSTQYRIDTLDVHFRGQGLMQTLLKISKDSRSKFRLIRSFSDDSKGFIIIDASVEKMNPSWRRGFALDEVFDFLPVDMMQESPYDYIEPAYVERDGDNFAVITRGKIRLGG